MQRLYTIAEAAEKIGVSKSWLYRDIRAGNLKAKKRRGTTRGYLLTEEIIDEYITHGMETVNE